MTPTKSVAKQPSVIFFFNVIGFHYLLLHHHSVVYHIRHIRLDDGFQFAFHLALTRRFPCKIVLHHHIIFVVIKPCHTLTIKEQHIIALHKKASGEENLPFRSFICFIRIVYYFQRVTHSSTNLPSFHRVRVAKQQRWSRSVNESSLLIHSADKFHRYTSFQFAKIVKNTD